MKRKNHVSKNMSPLFMVYCSVVRRKMCTQPIFKLGDKHIRQSN